MAMCVNFIYLMLSKVGLECEKMLYNIIFCLYYLTNKSMLY